METRVSSDARILCCPVPNSSQNGWLVDFAANLMNRCDVGSDGKTPLQRLHGRRDNTPVLEFGEKILYMPAKPAREESGNRDYILECLTLNSSSEAVVVTEQGLPTKTRAANVRRVAESERWDADRILRMRPAPWSPDGSDNAFDIQVGMERPPEAVSSLSWRSGDGKQSCEDLPSQSRLRTVELQRRLPRVPVLELTAKPAER